MVIFHSKHLIFTSPLFISICVNYTTITQTLYFQGFANTHFSKSKLFIKINSLLLSRHKNKNQIRKNTNIINILTSKIENTQTKTQKYNLIKHKRKYKHLEDIKTKKKPCKTRLNPFISWLF